MGTTICVASAYFPPHMGGVEQYASNLSYALVQQGYNVIVLTCRLGSDPEIERLDSGITILRIPAHDAMQRLALIYPGFRRTEAWQELERTHLDGMIVNTFLYPLCIHALKMAQQRSIPSYVLEHGSGYISLGNPVADSIIRLYERRMALLAHRFCPRFYGVSRKAADWLSSFGITASGVIPNAIDASAFRSCASNRNFRQELNLEPNTTIAVFTGRLIHEKGTEVLIECARAMQNRVPSVHLLVAGDGPARAHMESCKSDCLHILGPLDRPDVAALLNQANLFLFPSSYPEGLPTSLLEAAACECYIITSDIGGANEVLMGQTYGTTLPRAETALFVKAIEAFLSNPESHRLQARACRAHVEENLSWTASSQLALQALTS